MKLLKIINVLTLCKIKPLLVTISVDKLFRPHDFKDIT